jgi:hypothetical protein
VTATNPIDWGAACLHDPHWEIHQADARAIRIKGVTGNTVRSFKAVNKLPQGQPLSPEALQLFRDQRETQERIRKGEELAIRQALVMLAERATPERIAAITDQVDLAISSVFMLDQVTAKRFLLEGLPAVGIKSRTKLVAGVWADLRKLVPAASAHLTASPSSLAGVLPEDEIAGLCLFWGAVIRLAASNGEPPATLLKFFEWCGYAAFQSTAEHMAAERMADFLRMVQGNGTISTEDARQVLGLSSETALARKGINDAYRALARVHHPDTGGDAAQFQRLVAARDRLLLGVAA